MSRNAPEILDGGERNPLDALPLVGGGDAGIMGLDRRGGRRCRAEFLEGVSAGGLLDLPESDPSSETPERCCRRAADRVTGALYPSRASDVSESEGDGERTRVSGTDVGVDGMSNARTAKGGSVGDLTRPDRGRAQVFALSQAMVPQGIAGLTGNSMMGSCSKLRCTGKLKNVMAGQFTRRSHNMCSNLKTRNR